MSTATTFGARLKALREAEGLTLQELADKAGMHLQGVYKLEAGERSPSWDSVQALARALGVSCEAFQDEAPAPAKKRKGG
jgi:transcriptional regulator with XRE-family HTH domain